MKYSLVGALGLSVAIGATGCNSQPKSSLQEKQIEYSESLRTITTPFEAPRVQNKVVPKVPQCDEEYIAFATEGKDSKSVLQYATTLQDFDHLEASHIKACASYLDNLVHSGELEFYVRYGGSNPKNRTFREYLDVIDDDNDKLPTLQLDWAHKSTHGDYPTSKKLTGKGIRIGILDTGVDPDVEQFKDNIASFHDFVYDKTEAYDDGEHGTFVIGIIHEIVPDAQFYVYKIHDKEGENDIIDVLEGLDQVIADDIDILNNSWGLSEANELNNMSWNDANTILAESMERVNNNGTLIEVSSGNDHYYGTFSSDRQPAGSPHVISTGATDIRGEVAYFSNLDAHIFAPGSAVYSTEKKGHKTLSDGTSFSGPFATAALAVIDQYGQDRGKQFTRDEALEILTQSAKKESSTIIFENGKRKKFRFKALDFKRLVDYLEKHH